jgi:hypothetical protein
LSRCTSQRIMNTVIMSHEISSERSNKSPMRDNQDNRICLAQRNNLLYPETFNARMNGFAGLILEGDSRGYTSAPWARNSSNVRPSAAARSFACFRV